MKRQPGLSQEELKKQVRYEPDTGLFYRISANRHKHLIGKPTGSFIRRTKGGEPKHVLISLYPLAYGAHRLAWLYMTGEWALDDIDHINNDPFDNRWSNLRLATRSQNIANARKRCGALSKYKGVTYDARRKKWQVKVDLIHVGRFDTEEEAARAYDRKAIEIYGKFARTNEQIHGNL